MATASKAAKRMESERRRIRKNQQRQEEIGTDELLKHQSTLYFPSTQSLETVDVFVKGNVAQQAAHRHGGVKGATQSCPAELPERLAATDAAILYDDDGQ